MMRFPLSILALAFPLGCLVANAAGPAASLSLEPSSGIASAMLRILGALALVLALFFGLVWLLRHGQRLAWRAHSERKLRILESRSLGQRHTLYVVGYDRQRLLIASSPAQISLLGNLPPAEPGAETRGTPPPTTFNEVLRQLWGPKS